MCEESILFGYCRFEFLQILEEVKKIWSHKIIQHKFIAGIAKIEN